MSKYLADLFCAEEVAEYSRVDCADGHDALFWAPRRTGCSNELSRIFRIRLHWTCNAEFRQRVSVVFGPILNELFQP
jgi:hypothetical protein